VIRAGGRNAGLRAELCRQGASQGDGVSHNGERVCVSVGDLEVVCTG